VTNGAQVTFADGIHVIKTGPFVVDNNASVTGAHVAFYLQGTGANLTFAAASTINLAAPKDGSLAGILVFDNPTGAPAPEKPANHPKVGGSSRAHQILSNNARTLWARSTCRKAVSSWTPQAPSPIAPPIRCSSCSNSICIAGPILSSTRIMAPRKSPCRWVSGRTTAMSC